MKVLIVDDNKQIISILEAYAKKEGYQTVIAVDGQEALDVFQRERPDIILLDVMMPILSGIETLKQIRKNFSTPILMLSARGDDIDRVLGLELGADDYLAKPFNDRELVARIKAILRRTQNQPATTGSITNTDKDDNKQLNFGGITLYPGRQQALYQERDLDLTGTEFALLQILIKNPGQILSRELLSLEILGKRLTPFDRAIDMHISNLRKKLPERVDNLPWFKTLRGRGYLLVTEK